MYQGALILSPSPNQTMHTLLGHARLASDIENLLLMSENSIKQWWILEI